MRKLIVAFCLIATICAYHLKQDFKVVIKDVEYKNQKHGEKFVFPKDAFAPSKDVLNNIIKDFKINPRAGTEAIMNDYADQIFANLQNLFIQYGLDPFELPDQHAGFEFELIITYHGDIDLTHGWLMDLSTTHRGGDVIVSYSSSERLLEVAVPIAFNDLQFTYDYSATFMGLGPAGGIQGKVTDVTVFVKLGFDTDALQANLDEFEITNSGHISVDFNGNPLVDWIINLLADVVTSILKPLILLIVEDIIKGGLEAAVAAIDDAINGFLNPSTTVAPPITEAAFFRY